MIIRRADDEDIGGFYPLLQKAVGRGGVSRIGVKQIEMFLDGIEYIYSTTFGSKCLDGVVDHHSRDGFLIETSDNTEDSKGRSVHG